MDDDFAGWGEAQNPKSSPAYVEVAAIPSATVTVKQGEENVGEVKWGDVEEKKVVETPRMRVELLDRGRNWFTSTSLMTTRANPSLAVLTSVRRKGFPISHTEITIRSILTSAVGILTSVAISDLDKSPTHTLTVVVRGGYHAARLSWTSRADLSMSRYEHG